MSEIQIRQDKHHFNLKKVNNKEIYDSIKQKEKKNLVPVIKKPKISERFKILLRVIKGGGFSFICQE